MKVALQAGRLFSMMPTVLCELERQGVWKGSQKYTCTHFYRKTLETSISKPLVKAVWTAS